MLLAGASQLPTLATARLYLRQLTTDDVPALFAIFGDPEVCRYWSHPALRDVVAAEALYLRMVDGFAERSLFQWGIARRDTNTVIGTCTLGSLSVAHRRADLGYALARGAWGQGYVAEALPALLRFAFDELGLHRIEADVEPRNLRSVRTLEQLGFAREGLLRERYQLLGAWHDALLYGLLHPDWIARQVERTP